MKKSLVLEKFLHMEYPKTPNKLIKEKHELLQLNYGLILKEGLLDFDPSSEFQTIFGKVSYRGQVNQNGKAHGLGLYIDQNGNISEGIFKDGNFMTPYLDIHEFGYVAKLKSRNGTEYKIWFDIVRKYSEG